MASATTITHPPAVTTFDGDRERAWFGPRPFSLGLALILAMAFGSVLAGTSTFFFRDYGNFGYPLAHFHKECFWRGEMPLWNPLNCCGLPFLAQWNTLTLYPGSLIYLLLPLPWSLSFFCLLHMFLAGIGMYWLALTWTGRPCAAAVAGVGFALNGLILNCLMWPNNIAALGWMPWVILAAERGWKNGGRALLMAIGAGAIQMLAGAPEIILFTWLIVALIWAGTFWSDKPLRRHLLLRGTALICFIAGLTAAQLLPFLDLLGQSQRGASFSDAHWALPLSGWINFFLPLFGFYQSPSGVCFQPRQEWTSSYYPGVGIAVIALSALGLIRQRRVLLLWFIAGLGVLLALGEQSLVYMFACKLVPLTQVMRFPIKFIVLSIFALPLLAAYGVAGLSVRENRVTRFFMPSVVVALAVIAGALWYAYVKPPSRLAWAVLAENAVVRVACILLVATTVLLARRQDWRIRATAAAVLLVGLVLDVLTHSPWQNPTVAPSAFSHGMLETQLQSVPVLGTERALMSRQTHDTIYGWMLQDTFQDFCGRRLSMFGNCNLLDGVPTPDGFYSLYLPEQRAIWSDIFFTPSGQFPEPLADFLSISRVATNVFEWAQRPSAMPFVTAGQSPTFVNGQMARAGVNAPDFDPRRTVFLPVEAQGTLTERTTTAANVTNTRWQNSRVTFDVETGSPTLAVLAQAFHRNWRAYIDGKSTPILRANYAFQAVQIPKGQSRVELVYDDRAFKAGGVISIACLLGWMGLFWSNRVGVRKSAAQGGREE